MVSGPSTRQERAHAAGGLHRQRAAFRQAGYFDFPNRGATRGAPYVPHPSDD